MSMALEKTTFDTLDKIRRLYEATTRDEEKIYHIANMIGVLRPLEAFLHSKLDIARGGDGTKRIDADVSINIENNVSIKKE